ncbi:helix-turn-helix transcriptional regulator [Thalassospira sp. MCCC 1A01428]|uniref:helix-turn-helix domain-containing protein n=1 Tax=unclassified Thalassospira TaxID=2648997 RepID=UPI00111C1917|nr:helix-turn-helix transcriptional regulator [Thalassospira sp. MCCC 1A01428]
MKLAHWIQQNCGGSRKEFAKMIESSSQAIYRYEDGARVPAPKVMHKIVAVTGGEVTPNDFFDFSREESEAA